MGKGRMSHESSADDAQEENMAAWLIAVNTIEIQPFKLPPLGPHDVKVRMKAVGICGSDVHYLKNWFLGYGHELVPISHTRWTAPRSVTTRSRIEKREEVIQWP